MPARGASEAQAAELGSAAAADDVIRYSLVDTCRRHEVPYELARDKQRLQQSFLDHGKLDAFSTKQVEYASLDATAAARLYVPQPNLAAVCGSLDHLIQIEMPWTVVNARIMWNGVWIDPQMRMVVRDAGDRLLPRVQQQIAEFGIENEQSHQQLTDFFEQQGLLHAFMKRGRPCFDKDQLKGFKHLHPVVPLIYEARRINSLRSDMILTPAFDGVDGRVHPDHKQLAADSGRNSCRHPNLLGLDRTMRPLVVPDPGHGFGEVDLSQIDIGISAAVYGDARLITMFDTGDVYSAMAQLFYAERVDSPGDVRVRAGTIPPATTTMRDQFQPSRVLE